MRRSRVDFDYDPDYDFVHGNNDGDEARKSFLKDEYGGYNDNDDNNEMRRSFLKDEYGDDNSDDDDDDYHECEFFDEMEKCDRDDDDYQDDDTEEIDAKAEHFIAQFYEQMKLQRQLSYVRYYEMLDRSIS